MKPLTKNDSHPLTIHRKNFTFGQRMADNMTRCLGSWTFIISFGCFLTVWILINVFAWWLRWDPYPFILLNLALSCLAALQAPIIMMSQNRAAERDRIAANYDYAVNRKAEREIRRVQKDLEDIKAMLRK